MKTRFWLPLLAVVGLCLAPFVGAKEDKEKPKDKVIKTKSGLQYVELKEGKGQAAKKGDIVVVHYTGWLKSGKKFDSSVGKKPFAFKLGAGKVIAGWDEGVQGIKIGGKRKLIIPPELGYKDKDVGDGLIPANSTLIFEVELIKIMKDED